ncbi:MAG TPA: aldo/keto reductase, partial [Methylomirabilota bacterium]|nr:aldo/keto reductase [Methylomirabilota bacterium]
YRPKGWVEAGNARIEPMREVARKHGLTLLQLACLWNLSQPAVHSVVPTLIQETGHHGKPIEAKLDELASLPDVKLSDDECALIARLGDNKGCMELKGGNPGHVGEPMPDRWSLNPDLEAVGRRWGIDPHRDLVCTHGKAA